MTKETQAAILRACARFVRKQMTERDETIKSLQAEVARLSENPLNYQGPYSRMKAYRRGDVVTHHGSAFYCLRDDTESQPVSSDSKSESIDKNWQIFVQRGRDAARRTE